MPKWGIDELSGRLVGNDRQLSLVDDTEIREIAEAMDLPIELIQARADMSIEDFLSRMLAANIAILGLKTTLNEQLQPGSTLIFAGGGSVRVAERNLPCKKPPAKIKRALDAIDIKYAGGDFATLKSEFKKAAQNRRGWLGFVFCAGQLAVEDQILIRQPVAAPSPS